MMAGRREDVRQVADRHSTTEKMSRTRAPWIRLLRAEIVAPRSGERCDDMHIIDMMKRRGLSPPLTRSTALSCLRMCGLIDRSR